WPGNVRELENTIERCMILGEGNILDVDVLPSHIKNLEITTKIEPASALFSDDNVIPFEVIKEEAIKHALKVTKGNIVDAAKKLQLGRATIYRLMDKYKINSKDFENNQIIKEGK
nr:helix-turn-helix domain-containing protein [Ignavibacteriaceae bacterium]